MGLCPRCNRRLRASRRTRDGLDDLGDDYGFFDEEIDAIVDEAVRPRPTLPPRNACEHAERMLRRAERGLETSWEKFREALRNRRVGIEEAKRLLRQVENAERAVERWRQAVNTRCQPFRL